MPRSRAPAKQPNTMYFRSQTASKTQPLTSLSEDLKTMYSQAPKASFSGTCETAKHHVFQVPNGVKNTASNVTFWRPKDNVQSSIQSLVLNVQSSTQSLVLGHLRNSQTAPKASSSKQPKSRQKLQKSNPQAPSIRTGLLWRAPPYSEGSADFVSFIGCLAGFQFHFGQSPSFLFRTNSTSWESETNVDDSTIGSFGVSAKSEATKITGKKMKPWVVPPPSNCGKWRFIGIPY